MFVKRILINNLKAFYKGAIVACLLLLPLSVRCALVLEPETLDFGEIRYSDISEVTKKATIINNTDQTKSVGILNSSCACTTSTDFPSKLAPGEKRDFTVRLSPVSQGSFSNYLTIAESQPNKETLVLSVKGSVLPSAKLTFSPTILDVSSSTILGQKIGTVFVESLEETGDNIAEYSVMCKGGPVTAAKQSILSKLSFKADLILSDNPVVGSSDITVCVINRNRIICSGAVRLYVSPGIDVSHDTVYYGFIPLGEKAEKQLYVKGGAFILERAYVEDINAEKVSVTNSLITDSVGTTITVTVIPLVREPWLGKLKLVGKSNGTSLTVTLPMQGGAL